LIKECLNCKNEYKADRKSRKFCSRSCNATFNNKKRARIKSEKYICPTCGKKKDYRAKLCHICNMKIVYDKAMEKPISDYLKNDNHPRFKHNSVRVWAKKLMKYRKLKKKCICGYDKHVECCHKKPISEYSLDTPMKVVNSRENLIYLCPNCHWEFDNKLLEL